MKSDPNEELERGLLTAFRVLMLLPMFIIVPIPFIMMLCNLIGLPILMPTAAFSYERVVFPSFMTFTTIYLTIPRLQQLTGRYYLPIAIALSSLGPLWVLLNDSRSALAEPIANTISVIWAAPLFLLIPLTIIAWQYRYRHLVLYCLLLAGIEIGYGSVVGVPETVQWWSLIEFTVSRTLIFLSIGFLITRLMAAQRQQRSELAQANQQLRLTASTLEQLTVSRERNRIAHELHDTLAHTMSGMILQLEGIQMMWENDSQRARQSLATSIDTARQGLHETRRSLKALRATPLEEKGLVDALRTLTTDMAARNQLTLDLQLPPQALHLVPTLEQTTYRIAQEALTNIERHARAKTIRLALQTENGLLRLTICDDGKGFSLVAAEKSERFGLRGMRERADLVNGQLAIESGLGQGTKLKFEVTL